MTKHAPKSDVVERLERFAKEGAGVAVLIDAAAEIKRLQKALWRSEKHAAELLERLKASRSGIPVGRTPESPS